MGPALAHVRARALLRRSLRLGAIIGVVQLAPSGVAAAAPTVTFKALPVPIRAFPQTGNLSGAAGAAFRLELAIEGSEYGGHPPPLIGLTITLPKRTRVQSAGFPTCPAATLEPLGPGPSACPRGSTAGPPGRAIAIVAVGKELVPEKATLEPFYAKGGGLELLLTTGPPAYVSAIATAHYLNLTRREVGPSLVAELPLIAPAPGAASLSLERLTLQLGTAFKRGGKPIYHYTLPATCPSGGSPIQAELTFAGTGGLVPQTVTATYKMPCPRRRKLSPAPSPEAPAPQPAPQPAPLPAPPTALPGTGGAVSAPPNTVCLSHRDFTIHVVQIRGLLAYRRVDVYVNGHRVRVVRGSSITAPVDLRGLPKGRYTVRIIVTTTTGRRISSTRSYRTCAARPQPFGRPRL
jgi:hypothetical protein